MFVPRNQNDVFSPASVIIKNQYQSMVITVLKRYSVAKSTVSCLINTRYDHYRSKLSLTLTDIILEWKAVNIFKFLWKKSAVI